MATTTEPVPFGYCHCRCGGLAPIAKMTSRRDGTVKGQPVRFLPYQHTKVQWEDPVFRKRKSAASKAWWKDPSYRASQVAAIKIWWADPATREQRSIVTKAQCEDPAYRRRQSIATKVQWADPVYRASHEGAASATWRGDEIGYLGRHDRLRRTLGSASVYQCVEDCGRQAYDWSLNADVPEELLRADADGQQQGLSFSLYDAYYYPRCRSCHLKLDRRSPVAAV